jgi:hypothetical protein
VQRVALATSGGAYTGAVPTLLAGVQKPVAIDLAPDGAPFVGDGATGTIYRVSP